MAVPGFHHSKIKNVELKAPPPGIWHRANRSSSTYNLYNSYFGLARLLLLESSLRKKCKNIGISTHTDKVAHKIKRPPYLTQDNEFEMELQKSDVSSCKHIDTGNHSLYSFLFYSTLKFIST